MRQNSRFAWLLVALANIAFVAAGAYFLGNGGGFLGFFVGFAVLYKLEQEAYQRGFDDGQERAKIETDEKR
jgi:hypothetical protein